MPQFGHVEQIMILNKRKSVGGFTECGQVVTNLKEPTGDRRKRDGNLCFI
jgi:hypothetical protein